MSVRPSLASLSTLGVPLTKYQLVPLSPPLSHLLPAAHSHRLIPFLSTLSTSSCCIQYTRLISSERLLLIYGLFVQQLSEIFFENFYLKLYNYVLTQLKNISMVPMNAKHMIFSTHNLYKVHLQIGNLKVSHFLLHVTNP